MAHRIAKDGEKYSMEETCPQCDEIVGIILDDDDFETYEITCPHCGKQMMLCGLCGDDYGHNFCDWSMNNGCKLCNKRIKKNCALYKDNETGKLIREDWLKEFGKDPAKLELFRPNKRVPYCGKFTATISLTVGVDADDEDEAADLMEAFLGGTDKFYAECKTPTNQTLPLCNLLHAMKLVGELDNIEFTVNRKPGMDDANTYNWKNQGEITIRRDN